MTSTMLTKLRALGNDIDEFLERFENDEESCELMSIMFVNDTSFKSYCECLSNSDYKGCLEYLHEFKSVSSNIGLTTLAQYADEIYELIRLGHAYELQELNKSFSELYRMTIGLISENS